MGHKNTGGLVVVGTLCRGESSCIRHERCMVKRRGGLKSQKIEEGTDTK